MRVPRKRCTSHSYQIIMILILYSKHVLTSFTLLTSFARSKNIVWRVENNNKTFTRISLRRTHTFYVCIII